MLRARAVSLEGTIRVFISATSKDLGTVRELVKQALMTMRCMPIEQTNLPPDYRSVREMRRNTLQTSETMHNSLGSNCKSAALSD